MVEIALMKAMKNRKIAILTHASDKFESRNYLLGLLVEAWREAGGEIIVLSGTRHPEAADALFLHVDLTVIPDEYLAVAARYPVVINGRVRDISKRNVSANLIGIHDSYAGPVIVKTDRNCGGFPERQSQSALVLRAFRKLQRLLPWTWTGYLTSDRYPIYPSPGEVPRLVWHNRLLVVEKFIPEREGNYYATRHWLFLGDHEMSHRVFSINPIVKAANVMDRQYDLPVPDELRRLREELGLDYGKFDYVMVNGKPVLLDVNPTVGISSRINPSPHIRHIVAKLAPGLYSLLPPRAPVSPKTHNPDPGSS
jgi:hypothetical protein